MKNGGSLLVISSIGAHFLHFFQIPLDLYNKLNFV